MKRRRQSLLTRKIADMNWAIVLVMLLISMMGFVMMVSAGSGEFYPFASQQVVRFVFAFILMMIVALVPSRLIFDYAPFAYFACLIVLVVVEVMGHIGMGAQRWLRLGGFNVQPSEFMKLATIVMLARYFHQTHPEDTRRFSFVVIPLLLIALPAVLILKQPNLGTTVILVSVGLTMCFMAGMQWRYFIGAGLAGIVSAPIAWQFLHDYQRQRVLTFLDPEQDPLGSGYNIIQSMIAIGSGGFFGKGFLQGTQNQLNFLPEKHTDFIFTMLTEEFGFLGGVVMLLAYLLLLLLIMLVGLRSRSTFGALLAVGVTAMIFMHLLINVGMVMGLFPVVGLPLPLMSYGGSITVSTVLAIGLVLNAHINRDQLPMRNTPKL